MGAALIEWEIFVFARSSFDTITELEDKHLGVSETMFDLGPPLI